MDVKVTGVIVLVLDFKGVSSVFREFSCFLSPSLIHIACEDVKETAFTPFPSLFFLF